MPVSFLTTSRGDLMANVISRLTGLGYVWNQASASLTEYLAIGLTGITGSPHSSLRTSTVGLLSELSVELGGGIQPVLTSTDEVILAAINNAASGAGVSWDAGASTWDAGLTTWPS